MSHVKFGSFSSEWPRINLSQPDHLDQPSYSALDLGPWTEELLGIKCPSQKMACVQFPWHPGLVDSQRVVWVAGVATLSPVVSQVTHVQLGDQTAVSGEVSANCKYSEVRLVNYLGVSKAAR